MSVWCVFCVVAVVVVVVVVVVAVVPSARCWGIPVKGGSHHKIA